jgi:hypothetical protein
MNNKNDMGYHLYGDIKHDFGTLTSPATFYNINDQRAPTTVGASAISEDAVVKYFMNDAHVSDYKARLSGEVIFTVPEKTANFQKWNPPLLYAAGNDKIGIIQDAGEFITLRLGAKNVLSFGSILDPAGKPIAPAQQPIWYDPGPATTVDIPLEPFGFNPQIISALRVTKLTAGTVNASYVLNTGKAIDAVAMSPPAQEVTGGKGKRINQTDVEFSGFFTSIEKVSKLQEQLSLAGITNNDVQKKLKNENLVYFYIGKTLGDAMLVASGLPEFLGNDMTTKTKNPYHGIGSPNWKQWGASGTTVSSPDILALKTGDRLNYIRAIIMNLPAIYEQQAKGGRTKEYIFFPGTGNPEAVRASLLDDFGRIKKDVTDRYSELRTNLLRMAEDKSLRTKSSFAPGGTQVLRSDTATALAVKLLRNLADALVTAPEVQPVGGVCGTIVKWIDSGKTTAESLTNNSDLRSYYDTVLQIANSCSPQVTSLYSGKPKQEQYLLSKLIVANVPPEGAIWPLPSSLDISLRNAFDNFNKATSPSDTEYERLLDGRDIKNRFFDKLRGGQLGGMRGGTEPPLDIQDTVMEVVGQIEPESTDLATEIAPEITWEKVPIYLNPTNGDKIEELTKNDTGTVVYYNRNTGEITETPPWGTGPPWDIYYIYIGSNNQEIEELTETDTGKVVYYNATTREISPTHPEGILKGGAFLSVRFKPAIFGEWPNEDEFATQIKKILESFPRIRDFIDYMKSKGVVNKQQHFLSIYDVVRRRNTDRVLDSVLIQDLLSELRIMLGGNESTPYITIPFFKEEVFQDDYVYGQRDQYSNTPTLLFNAYVANIDAENSIYGDVVGGEIEEVSTQSTIDFTELEKSFLGKIPQRAGKYVFQPFEEAPKPRRPAGGLRRRRPLYTNA